MSPLASRAKANISLLDVAERVVALANKLMLAGAADVAGILRMSAEALPPVPRLFEAYRFPWESSATPLGDQNVPGLPSLLNVVLLAQGVVATYVEPLGVSRTILAVLADALGI